ncbi:NAD kinase [Flavobacteriales bacterium]|jgi:NAD+ kinase|nr:NAD kinase [Flavobacteriales bacterium]
MKIVVYGNKFNKEASPYVEQLFNLLIEKGVQISVNNSLFEFTKQFFPLNEKVIVKNKKSLLEVDTDFLISVGGDGTILDTITTVRDSNVPILGVNTGRLGFLANNTKDEIVSSVNSLLSGEFKIDSRTLLSLKSNVNQFGEDNFALNEFTLHKKDSSMMMTVHVFIDGEFLNSYWADGVIVATPTGSTAYSLSCGGPLLSPGSDNFVITPIAPHNLNLRPLVVKDDVEILLKMEGRDAEFLTTLDSRSQTVKQDAVITLKKASFNVNLIQFNHQNFFSTIRNKLYWGRDVRN